MPRPCQRRRDSAAAQRKSKPSKPSGPPPIQHKKRQKAIHNANRRARGGGRGGGRGGQPARLLRSNSAAEANHDFISFGANRNNFNVLHGAGSRHDPIALEGDDSMDDGETTDSGSDYDDSEDSEVHDNGALTINVEVNRVSKGKKTPKKAAVMFPMMQAIAIYKELSRSGFPLQRSTMARYGRDGALGTEPLQQDAPAALLQYSRVEIKSDNVITSEPTAMFALSSSSSHVSPASAAMSRQQSTSTATSSAPAARPQNPNAARDYVFDFGAHNGVPFTEAPENYLRTLAGNPFLLEKHPGVIEAFDYHRPNMRRKVPTQKQLASHGQGPVQAVSRGRVQGTRGGANKSWTTFTFPSGAHAKKKLNEVPENYLRTIEGMAHVMNKWVGLKEALLDYSAKTGRQTKVAS